MLMIAMKRLFTYTVLIGLIFCFGRLAMAASSMADYRSRIRRGIEQLSVMDEKTFETRGEAPLRALLPSNEAVISEGETIDIDNEWISVDIKELGSATSQAEKDKIYDKMLGKLKLLASDIDKLSSEQSQPDDQSK